MRIRPNLETLGQRDVPATFTQVGGSLGIVAAANGSYVEVDQNAGDLPGHVEVVVSDSSGYYTDTFNGVTSISFDGSSTGSNVYFNNTNINDVATAHGGVNLFEGGYGTSVLSGSSDPSGEDVLIARGAANTVNAGAGYDVIVSFAGSGETTVNGALPGDYVYAP